ncbi:MAG TPA: cell division protein FtsQ/DivIB [Candidatus Saccharimonadia bacterium]|nr:cell division protein FtsQ/DivIB [Candidatus Saccharimonadia bacterium]
MNERRVRVSGRQVYGRAAPLARPSRRRGVKPPGLGPLQRRLLVLLGLVIAAGWGIGQLFALTVVKVEAPVRKAEIESEVRKLVASRWQWGNLLTFDDGAFVSKLQQDDPLLRSVSVRRRWLHTIVVTATLKQPSLGWSTGNQTYVLDRDGTVIGTVVGAPAFPVVYDGSNLPVQVGQKAVSAHFVAFAGQVVPALAATGIQVARLDIKDTTLDLAATTNKGYRLLFDTGREVPEELADLQAVQRLLVAQKRTPAEYIDLRIAGKAYYK